MTGSHLAEWQEWRAALPVLPVIDSRGMMRTALTEAQAGLCGLCLDGGLKLVADHDHFSGFARGMLCHGCNTMEGRFYSDLVGAYRSSPPAAGMGWIWDEDGVAGMVMRVRGGREKRHVPMAVADDDLIGFDYALAAEFVQDFLSEQAFAALQAVSLPSTEDPDEQGDVQVGAPRPRMIRRPERDIRIDLIRQMIPKPCPDASAVLEVLKQAAA